MSGDDRQNSPSISRQNRPSATLIGLLCEKDPHSDLYKKLQVEFSWRQFRKQVAPLPEDEKIDYILLP